MCVAVGDRDKCSGDLGPQIVAKKAKEKNNKLVFLGCIKIRWFVRTFH